MTSSHAVSVTKLLRLVFVCGVGIALSSAAAGAPPVPVTKETKPKGWSDEVVDLVVIGGTPAGIACAVRAAREGLNVLLVNRHDHLGGILTSGLGVWDTQYEGKRSPIYDEVRTALFDHYRKTFGAESPQFRDALPGASGHSNGKYEPHVAERILTDLVSREKRVTVLTGFIPVEVHREGARIRGVVLRQFAGTSTRLATANVFADCTYEGDFAALAQVPYRVGREARAEFDEPHAGVIFMRPSSQPPTPELARLAALHDQLKLRNFAGFQAIMTQGSGAADGAVQACNYRTILTTDPANRAPIAKPDRYDPYFLKSLEIFSGVKAVPNEKFSWNRPQLIGQQTGYVEGDWATRQRVMDEHWDVAMGLLYFLQHDSSVPEKVRRGWLEYGLAKDEFVDNHYRPYEFYVREARRIIGRTIFTEHDATLAPGLLRAPVHAGSIAMTEWYMDTHSCTTDRVTGGLEEGKMMLHYETFPAQIPYGCLLPKGVDNLLVPVCLSASHVAWGTVRLEPVFMQTGESAGVAAALAVKRDTAPAQLDPDRLVRRLCEIGSNVTFFNDADVSSREPWVAAAEYFGTKGFFHDYDVHPNEALKAATGKAWVAGVAKLRSGKLDPMALARSVAEAEHDDHKLTAQGFAALLPRLPQPPPLKPAESITRKEAIRILYSLLP
jgi:hypothetical protein